VRDLVPEVPRGQGRVAAHPDAERERLPAPHAPAFVAEEMRLRDELGAEAVKIAGCCSKCDEPCFEVLARWEQHERRPGEPKRLGPPNPDAVRITFLLFNGRRTDMTLCGNCADTLGPADYSLLWRKNLAGWLREQNGNPEKFKYEFANGLLAELGRITWKELSGGG
jgi:hypothetical protein